jgi:peptide/nickel transport system permease protein
MIKEIFHNKTAFTGVIIIALLVAIAILSPLIAPNDPYSQHPDLAGSGPGLQFPLGCDYLGRCVLSRIIYGSRLSLSIAFVVVAAQTGIGIVLGTAAGYFGGLTDMIISKLIEIAMALPSLVLAIVIATVLSPGPASIMAALIVLGWTEFARVIRGSILSVKEKEYISAARVLGFSRIYIFKKYLLPNAVAPVITLASMSTGFTILIVSAFSFLGLGAQPPSADWGMMLNEGRTYMRTAPHLTVFPGIAIMITVLGFNLLGEGLRDILDPRYKTEIHPEEL